MKHLLLALLMVTLLPLTISAQKNPNANSYGTYDDNKKFIDTESHCTCWIQPDGTVFIDPGSRWNNYAQDYYPETLTLPETVTSPDGQIYKVTGTAQNGFQYSGIFGKVKKLIVPECYTTFDRQFANGGTFTSLEEVDAPGLIYLGADVFNLANKLKKVYMPHVKEITGMAFNACTSLETIDLPELETSNFSNYGSFANCSSLRSVNLPKLKNMTNYMFLGCKSLHTLYLPSVETLDPNAFIFGTLPDTLWLPKLKKIDQNFDIADKRLKVVIMPELEEISSPYFFGQRDSLTTLVLPKLKKVGWGCFQLDYGLVHVELPSLETVGDGGGPLFQGCSNLRYLSLPKYSKPDNNGNSFVAGCYNLDTLLVPSVPTLYLQGNYEDNYTKLRMLDISSIKADDLYSMNNWNLNYNNIDNLKHIICRDVNVLRKIAQAIGAKSETRMQGPFAYYDGQSIKDSLWIANGLDYAGFDSVEIVNQTEPMEDNVFCHLPNIKHLIIHGNTKLENMKAFSLLDNLETIDVAKDVTGDYSSVNGVLYDRSGHTLLYYPRANETAVDANGANRYPFSLPATLSRIGDYAFYGYPHQHQLAFGYSLEAIGAHALDGSHFNRVTFDPLTPLTTVGDYAFANMTEPAFRYLKFPTSLETIGEGAFANDAQMEAVELYDSKLTTVPDKAFAGLKNITSIALPNTVAAIGANAFDGNGKMEYFTVPTACTAIGARAFSGTMLKTLNIPNVNSSLTGTLEDAFPTTKPRNIFIPEGQSVSIDSAETVTSLPASIDKGKFYSFTRSYPVDLSDVVGKAKAFIVSNYNVDATTGKGLLYTESLSEAQLKAVPANTPVILLANSGATAPVSFTYKMLSSEPAPVGRSIVSGAPGAMRIDNKVTIDGTDYNSYVLQWASEGENMSGAFVPVTAKNWDEVSTRKGEQSYLQLPSTGDGGAVGSAKFFTFAIGSPTPTGISTIGQDNSDNDVWYNLQGQRVSKPVHGVYIHNGKIIVKH